MLRASEIRLLQALDDEPSITELADTLDRSPSYTSELVSDLESKGLVSTRRAGKKKQVRPVEAKTIELLQGLHDQYQHVDFPELVSGKAIPLLYYLDQPRTVTEIATLTDNYRNTVDRIVKRLRNRGILRKEGSRYSLTDDFRILHEFVREYVHHHHRQTASRHVSRFAILWESLDEFLLQTDESIDHENFHETGPARFQDHGLPLVTTSRNYYHYSGSIDDLSIPELVCQTLLIDDGTRYRTYCLLLIAKTDPDRDRIQAVAENYGIGDTVEEMIAYLETEGDETTAALPDWDEFRATAADYEVNV